MENYPILYEEQTKHGNISFPCAVYTINAPIDETEKIYCHWHKEVELLYIMEGHAALTLDDHVIPVNQGDCIFIPSNHVHMVTGDNTSFCFTAVVFHPDLVRSFGSDAIERCISHHYCNGSLTILQSSQHHSFRNRSMRLHSFFIRNLQVTSCVSNVHCCLSFLIFTRPSGIHRFMPFARMRKRSH